MMFWIKRESGHPGWVFQSLCHRSLEVGAVPSPGTFSEGGSFTGEIEDVPHATWHFLDRLGCFPLETSLGKQAQLMRQFKIVHSSYFNRRHRRAAAYTRVGGDPIVHVKLSIWKRSSESRRV